MAFINIQSQLPTQPSYTQAIFIYLLDPLIIVFLTLDLSGKYANFRGQAYPVSNASGNFGILFCALS